MPWLLRDGDVLAAIEDRQKGWHHTLRGALILKAPTLVHTLSAPVSLDVAWCGASVLDTGNRGLLVKRVGAVAPRRLAVPQLAGALVVATGGTFERWRLNVGDILEIRGE